MARLHFEKLAKSRIFYIRFFGRRTRKNPSFHGEKSRGNTQDYIFLLRADEVEELFDDEVEDYVDYEERGAVTTIIII